jgi:lipoprotein-anchoring transpeptidase ErfK/SrfK
VDRHRPLRQEQLNLRPILPIPAAVSRHCLRLALGFFAIVMIGTCPPAKAQVFWQDPYPDAYAPDIYIDDAPPTPVARRQPHRRHRHLTQPRVAANPARKPRGPLIIAISINRQTMKVYDANGFFAETPVSTGMRDHSTPLGVFSVIQKQKWHRSNIYSGAPMPYMQRITWSGIAMHAGVLPGYPASHGCIRMPMSFAIKLWGWTRTGARVIITPGEVTPAEFSHPMLVTHRPEPVPVDTAAVPDSTVGEVHTADAGGAMPQASPPGLGDSPAASATASAEHRHDTDAMASADPSDLRSAIDPDNTPAKPASEPTAVSTDRADEIKSSEAKSTDIGPAEGHADTGTPKVAATDAPAIQPDPGKTTTAHEEQPKTASAAGPGVSAAGKDQLQSPPANTAKAEVLPTPKRTARIAVFVSRKDSKIYVRQNFAPLFDAPITITASDRPLGTHVFTAEADKDSKDDFHWSVVSLPAVAHRAAHAARDNHTHRRNATARTEPKPAPVPDSAADALNRIAIPEDVMTKIAEALTTGDSIVVSDQGISGGETGEGTDFIVTLH